MKQSCLICLALVMSQISVAGASQSLVCTNAQKDISIIIDKAHCQNSAHDRVPSCPTVVKTSQGQAETDVMMLRAVLPQTSNESLMIVDKNTGAQVAFSGMSEKQNQFVGQAHIQLGALTADTQMTCVE